MIILCEVIHPEKGTSLIEYDSEEAAIYSIPDSTGRKKLLYSGCYNFTIQHMEEFVKNNKMVLLELEVFE